MELAGLVLVVAASAAERLEGKTMERFLSRPAWLLFAPLGLLVVVANIGCSIVATGLWAIDPNDRTAEYDGLKKQRVVVVCRQTNSLEYRNSGVAKVLGVQVAKKLKDEVKEIEIVPQSDVDDWLDNNELVSYIEIGKALQADKVVAIDLENFNLFQGSTLFQGQAAAQVVVFDVATEEEVFERVPLETLYPPSTPVARDSSVSEALFRRKFVEVLADQIARTFYPHDSRQANAKDIFF